MSHEDEFKSANEAAAGEAETPMDKLRCLLLARGYTGILQFGRLFRRSDDDGSSTLNLEELGETLQNFGVEFSEDEAMEVFKSMDEDESGSILYNEFLAKLRPEMNEERMGMVDLAFEKLDESGDGVVTLEDVSGKYSAANHPKVLEGEMTEEDVLTKFLGRFENATKEDGKVTKDEFVDYYSGVSKSIDDDEMFVAVMKNSWGLEYGPAFMKTT